MRKKTYRVTTEVGSKIYTFERKTSNYFTWAIITQEEDTGKVACSFHKNYRTVEAKQQSNSKHYWLKHLKVVNAFEVKDN